MYVESYQVYMPGFLIGWRPPFCPFGLFTLHNTAYIRLSNTHDYKYIYSRPAWKKEKLVCALSLDGPIRNDRSWTARSKLFKVSSSLREGGYVDT